MKKILFILFVSIGLFATEDISELQLQLSDQFKSGKYTEVLDTLDKIKHSGVELPPSFEYFEAKAFYKTGQKKKAYKKFKAYMKTTNKSNILYKQSKYYVSKIDRERRPKPVKRNDSKRQYVCYDNKGENSQGKLIYNGCARSVSSCKTKGKLHFGKYPTHSKASQALKRCQRSNPRFVD